jgi:hypothetical protein
MRIACVFTAGQMKLIDKLAKQGYLSNNRTGVVYQIVVFYLQDCLEKHKFRKSLMKVLPKQKVLWIRKRKREILAKRIPPRSVSSQKRNRYSSEISKGLEDLDSPMQHMKIPNKYKDRKGE